MATPALDAEPRAGADRQPVEADLSFDVAPNAKIDGDYWVFVHVLEPDGEQLWTDDHLPPTPTSKWKPGQKVEYTRTVFVPNYPYIGPAIVRLGLYDPKTSRRLTLGGDAAATREEYQVAKFELQPQSENIFLIFKEGWHPNEVAGNDPNTEWQWTKKSATISFRNPKKDGTVYLEYAARIDKFTPPQQVTLRIGDQQIGTFAATSQDRDARSPSRSPRRSSAPATWPSWSSTSTRRSRPAARIRASSASRSSTPLSTQSNERLQPIQLGAGREALQKLFCSVSGQRPSRMVG